MPPLAHTVAQTPTFRLRVPDWKSGGVLISPVGLAGASRRSCKNKNLTPRRKDAKLRKAGVLCLLCDALRLGVLAWGVFLLGSFFHIFAASPLLVKSGQHGVLFAFDIRPVV